MNKQELIKHIEDLPYTEGPIADTITINRNWILESIEQLAESETGNADEAPRYVKNILARLRELPLHDREVWIKAIMGEFEQDFSHAKWREGYEQGKFEGMVKREKVTIPQFVADWIEVCKEHLTSSLYLAMTPSFLKSNNQGIELILWIKKNEETFARAWLDCYTVEKEKRYTVVMKETKQPLYYNSVDNKLFFSMGGLATNFTKQQLEQANVGWVFDCPGVEVEEVE